MRSSSMWSASRNGRPGTVATSRRSADTSSRRSRRSRLSPPIGSGGQSATATTIVTAAPTNVSQMRTHAKSGASPLPTKITISAVTAVTGLIDSFFGVGDQADGQPGCDRGGHEPQGRARIDLERDDAYQDAGDRAQDAEDGHAEHTVRVVGAQRDQGHDRGERGSIGSEQLTDPPREHGCEPDLRQEPEVSGAQLGG